MGNLTTDEFNKLFLKEIQGYLSWIEQDEVAKWSMLSTLKNNAIAILGPLF